MCAIEQDSSLEKRQLALERRTLQVEALSRKVVVQVKSLWQDLFDEPPILDTTTPPTPAPNTTFSGFLTGCNATHLACASVTLARTSDGMILWTGSATGGVGGGYSGSCYLSANTACTLTAVSPAARLDNISVSRTLNFGVSNTLASAAFPPIAGYSCLTNNPYPLKNTLNLADSRFGNFSLGFVASNWQGGPGLPGTYYLLGTNVVLFMDGDSGFNNGQAPFVFPPAGIGGGVIFTYRVNAKPAGSPWNIGDIMTVTEV